MPGKDFKPQGRQPAPNRAFALRMLNPMRYQEGSKSPLDKALRPVKDTQRKKSAGKKVSRSESFSSADDDTASLRSWTSSATSNSDFDDTDEYIKYSLERYISDTDRPYLHRTMSAIGSFTHGKIRSALSSPSVNGKRDKKSMKVRFADNKSENDVVRDVLVRSSVGKGKQRNHRLMNGNGNSSNSHYSSSTSENIVEFRTASAPPDLGYSRPTNSTSNGITTGEVEKCNGLKNDNEDSDSDNTVVGEEDFARIIGSQRSPDTAEGSNEVRPFDTENEVNQPSSSKITNSRHLVEACPDILVTSFESGEKGDYHQSNEVVRRREKSRPYGRNRDEFAKRLSWVCNLLSERCPGDFQVLEALVEMQYAYERREEEVNKTMTDLKSQVKLMENRLKALELFTLPGFSKVVTPMSEAAGALFGALQNMNDACRNISDNDEVQKTQEIENNVFVKDDNQDSSISRRGPSPETPV